MGKGIGFPALRRLTGEPLPTLPFSGILSLGELVISLIVSLTACRRAFLVGVSESVVAWLLREVVLEADVDDEGPHDVTRFLGRLSCCKQTVGKNTFDLLNVKLKL